LPIYCTMWHCPPTPWIPVRTGQARSTTARPPETEAKIGGRQ
jgi:hypothetical protein